MNLVAHLARKDLRRILIPGALYAFFLAVKLVLGVLALRDIDASQFAAIRDYLKVSTFAEGVMGYVLVAAIVQEDPVVGANAFWMTRPISGLRLLAAKLVVLLALLILLPVLIALPWWGACHLGFHHMALAAAHVALVQMLLVGFGLPFAVLTANLSRYLACTLGVVAALAAWMALMTSTRGRFLWHNSSDWVNAGASDTRGGIFVGILIVTLIILLVHQYRTRRTRRSIAILAVGLTLATTVMATWRWDWSPLWKPFSPPNALADAIDLKFEIAELSKVSSPLRNTVVTVQAHFSGVPAGHVMDTFFTRQEWRSPDGTETFLKSEISGPSVVFEPVAREMLGLSATSSAASDPAAASYLRQVRSSVPAPASLARAIVEQPFDLTLRVQTRLLRPFIVAETALEMPASIDTNGYTLRIQKIDMRTDDELVISTVEIFPPSTLPLLGSPEVFLIDRASNRIIPVSESRAEQIPIAGVSIGARTATFRASGLNTSEDAAPHDSRAMPPHLRLVYVGYELVGKIHRKAHVPHIDVTVNPSRTPSTP